MGFNGTSWDLMGILTWLVVSTSLKNLKVNGKDDIPYTMESHKIHIPVTTNQIYIYIYLSKL